MTLIDSALARVGLQVKAERVPRPGYGGAPYGPFYGGMQSMRSRQLQRLAMQSAWVYSDIKLISGKVGGAKLNIETVTGEESEPIVNHPFEVLMRRPNALMSGSFLMQYTSMWLGLGGEAYWWLGAIGRELLEIWPLPARDVTPVPAPEGSESVLAGYRYTPMGERLIPAEMVVHFKTVNPFDVLRGYAPVIPLELTIRGGRAQDWWNFNWFDKRNATPTTIISLPATTGKQDFDRLSKQIEERFGGIERASMVTKAGHIDVEQVGISQKDMDFLGKIELDQATVDRAYGVHGGYWAKDASRNVSETAARLLLRDTVQPQVDYIADETTAQVIEPFYGEGLRAVADNLVPEDRELERREWSTYTVVMTVDEARAALPSPMEPLGGAVGETLRGAAQFGGAVVEPAADDDGADEAAKADLRRWMRVAASAAAKGKAPGEREFVSECIPWPVQEQIVAGLARAESGAEVRAVFGPWVGNGRVEAWRGYP